MTIIALAGLLLAQATPTAPTPAAPAPSDPIAVDWRAIPADELLVMTLADGRTVVIRLAARFAPEHVANIRKIARAKWWDGESVYRVQENWVAQWGDPTEKKPLPPGVVASPAPEFEIKAFEAAQRLAKPDAYSAASGLTADGWPIATDGKAAWLPHCYGSVGVARDALPNTGSGSELFTPIGQSARRLDRNYTVVGRIVEGMQHVSSLKRSDAAMGVYAEPSERTPIMSVMLASDMPEATRPRFDVRTTDNPRFAAYLAQRYRPEAPTVAVGLNVCDLSPQVRRAD